MSPDQQWTDGFRSGHSQTNTCQADALGMVEHNIMSWVLQVMHFDICESTIVNPKIFRGSSGGLSVRTCNMVSSGRAAYTRLLHHMECRFMQT